MYSIVSMVLVAAAPLTQDGRAEPHINGGAEVEPCGWPTAVAVSGGGGLCTGTLIHPEVVVYAAHCGGGTKQIRFVESLSGFGQSIPAQCLTNPGYSNQSNDYAFCVLDQPADVPFSPAVYGCETEILTQGRQITVVGFGNNDPGETGAGIKRWGETIIGYIDTLVMNIPGGTSVCSGDSGGPAFVQYPDGTYHPFSIASTVSGGCGGSGTYALIENAIPFIESESGIDVTPCHTVDGAWDPSPRCQGFFSGDQNGHGSWSDWCEGTPAGPSSETCGAAFDAVPDNDAPAVAITSPANLETFEADGFPGTIVVDASDVGWGMLQVRMKINGEEQELADDEEPWEFNNVNFPQGQWELIAVAEDWAGNISESEPVLIGVGEEPIPPEPETTGGSTGGDTEGVGTEEPPMDDEDEDEEDTTGPPAVAPMESGCGCSQSPPLGALFLLPLLAFVRRRR